MVAEFEADLIRARKGVKVVAQAKRRLGGKQR